jgi:hypothetical protein
MLSHCANAKCSRPFLRLGQGKLFLLETECVAKPGERTPPSYVRQQARRVERYWLCDQCAGVWTLVHDQNQGIALVPRPRPPVRAGVAEAYGETA